jgi:hypothetical protein
MARNRIIYQSESLFTSKGVQSTATGDHAELIRVQSANYGFTINRQDVNQYGNLARLDSLVIEAPVVSFDFSYYLGDGVNEKALGFNITEAAQFTSGFMGTGLGRNFYIATSDEGQDSTTFLGADPYGLIGIGNAFLSDYTMDLSVGSLATANVSFEAANINSLNGAISGTIPSEFSLTGTLPSIDSDGEPYVGSVALKTPSNTGQNGPTAIKPGDILLSFPGFDEGATESGTLTEISGAGAFHVQSASLSIPLSRTALERVGSKFPFSRVVDFPINASLTVNAIVNEVQAGNLADIVGGCGDDATKDVSIQLNDCDGSPAIKWTLKKAILEAESFSSSVGSNKTVDLTFGVQLGGIDDVAQGVICSGLAQSREVFGV